MALLDSLTTLFASQSTGFDFNLLVPQRVGATAQRQTGSANATRIYSVTQSRDAVTKALAGAKSVLDQLQTIGDKVESSNYLGPATAGRNDPRSTLQTDIRALTRQVNDTVAGAKPRLVVLEVNTQPGMTATSLVPDIAAHMGITFPELVRWMVENAVCDG